MDTGVGFWEVFSFSLNSITTSSNTISGPSFSVGVTELFGASALFLTILLILGLNIEFSLFN